MRVNSRIMWLKDLAISRCIGEMVEFTKVIGSMVKCMAKVNTFGLMVQIMWVILRMTKKMGMESLQSNFNDLYSSIVLKA